MAYDFQAAVNAAKEVVERQESSGEGKVYTYPLVYPQKGSTIVVRPLFNPASSQIVRLVSRHEKVPCYRSYGIECPICKTMQQVKDMTGQDPFGRTKSSRSRGICFAQYISSSNQIDKGNNKGILQPGEVILLMYPWSVYQQINTMIQAIAQTPTGMDQAFCHSQSGLFIQIQVTNDFKYTTTQVPYMTFPSQQSDDDFLRMLDGMDSLNEQVIPSTVTEEVDKQVKEYTDAIVRQYITPRVPNLGTTPSAPVGLGQIAPTVPGTTGTPNFPPTITNPAVVPNYAYGSAPSPVAVPDYAPNDQFAGAFPTNPAAPIPQAPQIPTTPVTAPPASTTVQQSNTATQYPECFGRHQNNVPQCIVCPVEMNCIEKSNPPF